LSEDFDTMPISPSLPDEDLLTSLAIALGQQLDADGLMMVSAESCTGGMIAAAMTEIAGSSGWFERGYVTYSNDAKTSALGVPPALIAQHGAVSEPVAAAMVDGALAAAGEPPSKVAVSVTGIAGPGGGSAQKPVGTVCFGWRRDNEVAITDTRYFDGDRASVRRQAAAYAMQGVLRLIDTGSPLSVA